MSEEKIHQGWTSSKVRSTFIDYFKSKNHTFWKSSKVIPHDDPTLLFSNAGMNQFKSIFLGQVAPGNPMATLKTACNSQKCIRAGGKHNDLDDVGKDSYHHTFFEMLGNWSFGDYHKEGAITMAWELLTKVYKLDPKRIYVTYFGGDSKKCAGIPADVEAKRIWHEKCGLPYDRILPFDGKDNFWEMGETGPCGPCSEIHYDKRPIEVINDPKSKSGKDLVNMDDMNVIEIWNLVFITFNRGENKKLEKLDKKHVDTGMGFERVAAILQNKSSNYEIDMFTPIFDFMENKMKKKLPPYQNKYGSEDVNNIDTTYRVIADHIRTCVIAITDGCLPDASGRGYVIRRIIRRAIRFGFQFFKLEPDFFSSLVEVTVKTLEEIFPETRKQMNHVIEVLKKEEKKFSKLVKNGSKIFNNYIEKMEIENKNKKGKNIKKIVDGKFCFLLYDSHGFPIDLTQIMAEEKGYTVDLPQFFKARSIAVEKSKNKKTTKEDLIIIKFESKQTEYLKKEKIETTDDSFKYIWNDLNNSKILAIYNSKDDKFIDGLSTTYLNDNKFSENDMKKSYFGLVLDKTNFYYESGGQIADSGIISTKNGDFQVLFLKSYAGFIVHMGYLIQNDKNNKVVVGDIAELKPDFHRRKRIASNHTTTHMLNYALRSVLDNDNYGGQQGSYVDEDRLRFDYKFIKKQPTTEQIIETEKIVNKMINNKYNVYTKYNKLEESKKINGVCHMFDEYYPDPVRVVSIGAAIDKEQSKGSGNEYILNDISKNEWKNYSIEFCGGTHLENSKDAECFVIIMDNGIAEGKRRIIGLTRKRAKVVNELAESFQKRIENCLNIEGDDKKENEFISEVNSLLLEIDSLTVSIENKIKMKKQLKKLYETVKLIRKKNTKNSDEKGINFAENIIKNFENQDKDKVLIIDLPFEQFSEKPKKTMEKILSYMKTRLPKVPVMCCAIEKLAKKKKKNEKGLFICDVPKDLTDKLSAVDWIKNTAALCKGKGGGKPFHAQGQGTDISKFKEAVKMALEFGNKQLN